MENSGLCLENERSWVELPGDVSLNILMRVDQIEIVECAQFVCKPWYDLCKEPSLWRSIRFKNLENPFQEPKRVFNHEKMVFHAIDRSAGGLIDLDIMDFVPYKLGNFIAFRSTQLTQLKRLRFACCRISIKPFVKALEKLSSLDELELTMCYFNNHPTDIFEPTKVISIINSCPSSLTTLNLNQRRSIALLYRHQSDKVALAIAGSLPKLQHLQFIGHDITNVGLMAILDGCPLLQSLDLSACIHLVLEGNLWTRLSKQVKYLLLPYDPTLDYYYPTLQDGYDFDDVCYVDTDFDAFYG